VRFLDQCKIYLKSGQGGDGCISFRREKYVAYGGPDGGDGGKGGDIILRCVPSLNTLIDYRYKQHFKASRGGHGMGRNRTGAAGRDVILELPLGTQVLSDDEESILLADMTEVGQEVTLLRGGDGGFGNDHYKTATEQTPRKFQPGFPGKECWIWLRLKLLADVGLIGAPNAGKSSLLNRVSNAKSKVGTYPFTTLHPQLGVVAHKDREFVMADIPGLISGASEGQGLGDRFLGHIERCRILIHLIETAPNNLDVDPGETYRQIRKELEAYGSDLQQKPEIVVLNKCDLLPEDAIVQHAENLAQAIGVPVLPISVASGYGTKALLDRLIAETSQAPPAQEEVPGEWSPVS